MRENFEKERHRIQNYNNMLEQDLHRSIML